MARWHCPSRIIYPLHKENIRDQFEERTGSSVGLGFSSLLTSLLRWQVESADLYPISFGD